MHKNRGREYIESKAIQSDVAMEIKTAQAVKKAIHEFSLELSQVLQLEASILNPIEASIDGIELVGAAIVAMLAVPDAPNLSDVLETFQGEYTNAAIKATNIIARQRVIAQEAGLQGVVTFCDNLEVIIKTNSSGINDAVKSAISENDLNPLQRIADKSHESIRSVFRAERDKLDTKNIANERRISRAGVYIGYHLNRIRHERNITSTNRRWKMIYQTLKQQKHSLKGDADDAFKYFESWQPDAMTRDKLRGFEQELNRYEKEMAPYWSGAQNSRQTPDKEHAD